jgi:hypothetical protein
MMVPCLRDGCRYWVEYLVIMVRCLLLLLVVDVDQNGRGVKQVYSVKDILVKFKLSFRLSTIP